jgi:hypothetical protein
MDYDLLRIATKSLYPWGPSAISVIAFSFGSYTHFIIDEEGWLLLLPLALTPPALLCVRHRPRPKHKRAMWPTYCYRIDCRFRRLHNNSTWLKQEKEGIEYTKGKRQVVKERTNDCAHEPDRCNFSTPIRPEPLTTLDRVWRARQRFQRLVVRLVRKKVESSSNYHTYS